MKNLFFILILSAFYQCKPNQDKSTKQFPEKPEVPSSIKKTHESLLEKVHKMTQFKDSSGRVAVKLEAMMRHHFGEEEDFVLPALGLLPMLANGEIPDQSKDIILLSEKAKREMNHMSAEHQLIDAYMEELKQASEIKNLPEIAEFEKEINKHANLEEEVLFPTSILIGDYLKLKLKGQL